MGREERGAALVEFALALPLLLVVLAGIVDFGFAFQRYEVITNAAREGARLASLPGFDDQTSVDNRVRAYVMQGLNIPSSSLGAVMPSGAVTRGHRVGVRSLGDQIRPIHSGILVRRGEKLRPPVQAFIDFLAPAQR